MTFSWICSPDNSTAGSMITFFERNEYIKIYVVYVWFINEGRGCDTFS